MIATLRHRWRGPGGCGQVLRVAFPLIVSMGAHTVQMFVDRIFLTWHNVDEMTAAMPAGITSFAITALVMGTVGYVSTFVAQYTGADRPQRVGPAVWQAIFCAIFGGVVLLARIPAAPYIFDWFGHDQAVRTHEIIYFQLLSVNTVPMLICVAISGFFTGRGKTWIVMFVNIAAVVVNIVLDWCWIFGRAGFPEWGIAGAAWATIVATCFGAVIYILLFLWQSK